MRNSQVLSERVAKPVFRTPSQLTKPRPTVRGKFIYVGETKLYLRGVTYGAFRPDLQKREYRNLNQINADFAQMAASGMNAVRIPHTMPPRQLLDIAHEHGLYVMVGLSAEQYVGYLIDRKGAPDIEAIVRAKVREVAGHPALLCYALGNELPASIVRWLGRKRVECYLKRLFDAVKSVDAEGIVTYVNYPTTEYLQLPFLDLLSFNVYLESQDRLEAYLARLQNLAGDRPLLMSEVGLDSMRNGEEKQAHVLDWQIRTIFASGCAGAFVFAWTDEWHRDGEEVYDWEFGITDRARRPKSALFAVREAFSEVPFSPNTTWPPISVVVCSYNGNQTIRECMSGLKQLVYPNFEVIVVDDGSRKPLEPIVREFGFRVIRTENRGLSHARNVGADAATGDIVAYIDDDAYPDPHWLHYIAAAFTRPMHVAVGGPNLLPLNSGDVAHCVANSPGGPYHVLLSDRTAEHVPGCNLAVRKKALEAIGGFDTQFRVAGDDVDFCWRLQENGGKIGFHAGAMVWHHRRGTVKGYWRQQLAYGMAEAMLEKKWPGKYNTPGHVTWSGRVYSPVALHLFGQVGRIYQGMWGSAPFQRLYQASPNGRLSLLMMPEWYVLAALLGGLSCLGVLWPPMLMAIPLLAVAISAVFIPSVLAAKSAFATINQRDNTQRLRLIAVTTMLHLIQPVARLVGRLRGGLLPWRRRTSSTFKLPYRRTLRLWTSHWKSPLDRLTVIDRELSLGHPGLRRGGDFDCWDLEVPEGMAGGARIILSAEDHAGGHQLVRIRCWPTWSKRVVVPILILLGLAIAAGLDHAWTACTVLASAGSLLGARLVYENGTAQAAILDAVSTSRGGESSSD